MGKVNNDPSGGQPLRTLQVLRILAAPCFRAILSGHEPVPEYKRLGFETCLRKIRNLFLIVDSGFMDFCHVFSGGFKMETVRSPHPRTADIVIVIGPGDTSCLNLLLQYCETQDESLFADFSPITPRCLPGQSSPHHLN